MITHIVFFKLKEPTPEVMQKTKDVLLGMEGRIDVLRHLEAGFDVVRSGRSYDVALVTKFDSLADLDAYQVHPVHQDVVAYIKSVAESSAAVDYES